MRLLQFLSLCFTALIIGYYANSPAIAPNPSSSLAAISAEGTADAGVGAAASGVGTAGGNVGASATGHGGPPI